MVTRVRKKTGLDETAVAETFEQWCTVKAQEAEYTERKGTLRKRMVDWLEQFGETDDKGHKRLPLTRKIDGFAGLKYERRVARHLDPDAAERILGKKRLLKECQTTITVLDESAIEALMFKKKLSEDEYNEIFVASETWAFKPEK